VVTYRQTPTFVSSVSLAATEVHLALGEPTEAARYALPAYSGA
jgi:hypothetical protein